MINWNVIIIEGDYMNNQQKKLIRMIENKIRSIIETEELDIFSQTDIGSEFDFDELDGRMLKLMNRIPTTEIYDILDDISRASMSRRSDDYMKSLYEEAMLCRKMFEEFNKKFATIGNRIQI